MAPYLNPYRIDVIGDIMLRIVDAYRHGSNGERQKMVRFWNRFSAPRTATGKEIHLRLTSILEPLTRELGRKPTWFDGVINAIPSLVSLYFPNTTEKKVIPVAAEAKWKVLLPYDQGVSLFLTASIVRADEDELGRRAAMRIPIMNIFDPNLEKWVAQLYAYRAFEREFLDAALTERFPHRPSESPLPYVMEKGPSKALQFPCHNIALQAMYELARLDVGDFRYSIEELYDNAVTKGASVRTLRRRPVDPTFLFALAAWPIWRAAALRKSKMAAYLNSSMAAYNIKSRYGLKQAESLMKQVERLLKRHEKINGDA